MKPDYAVRMVRRQIEEAREANGELGGSLPRATVDCALLERLCRLAERYDRQEQMRERVLGLAGELERPAPCDCYDGERLDCGCHNMDDYAGMVGWLDEQDMARRLRALLPVQPTDDGNHGLQKGGEDG